MDYTQPSRAIHICQSPDCGCGITRRDFLRLSALTAASVAAPLLSAGEGVTILSCLLGGTIGFLLVRYFSARLEQGEYGPRMLGVVLNTRHLS